MIKEKVGSMKKKILITCNTPYHLLLATNLKTTRFRDAKVDLIISDNIVKVEKLIANVKQVGIFNSVYQMNVNHIEVFDFKSKFILSYRRRLAKKVLNKDNILLDFSEIDEYIMFNTCGIALFIGEYIKAVNKGVKISLAEDGIISYNKCFEKWVNNISENPIKNVIKNIYFNIFPTALKKIENFYFMAPEYLDWSPKGNVIKMESIDIDDENTVDIYNRTFGYYNLKDDYNKDIIFFDSKDDIYGHPIDDISYMDRIAEIYGKENIIVKIHPRNPDSVYKRAGYYTNKDTFIPWEIIAMNNDIEKKLLITVGSNSIITTKMLFGKKVNAIMMFRLLDYRSFINRDHWEYLIHFYNKDHTFYSLPETEEEFSFIVKEKMTLIKE